MGWGSGMHEWSGHWLGGGWMAVLWILVIVVVFLLVRGFVSGAGGRRGNPETPLEILKRRYANGEMDKAEFEEKKKGIAG